MFRETVQIAVSSCARPRFLEKCLESFHRNLIVPSWVNFELIICEDYVEDPRRRAEGREWIEENSEQFSRIKYLDKNAGFGFHVPPLLDEITSEFFFRLEDDHYFIKPVDLGLLLEMIREDKKAISIILRRDHHQFDIFDRTTEALGHPATRVALFSDSIGMHNTEKFKVLLNKAGSVQLHERQVLTPLKKKLGYNSYVLGARKYQSPHYIHLGKHSRQGSYT